MYGTFGGFAGYFKAKKSYIDNTTFRLHYRTTFAILVNFSQRNHLDIKEI